MVMGFLAYLAQGVFDVGISIYEEGQSDNRQGDEELSSLIPWPYRGEEGADSHDSEQDFVDEFMPGRKDRTKEGKDGAEDCASKEGPHKKEDDRSRKG